MEQDRICDSCKVSLSSDLSNCPLCGKHLAEKQKPKENKKSYPIYNLKFVESARWYNIIRTLFWLAGIVCVLVNLYFKTQPFWYPYVLAGLIMTFYVFIRTIKRNVSGYIKSLIIMSILVSLFLIFIDAYNYYSYDIGFGWAFAYAAPCIMSAGVLASAVFSFLLKRYEVALIRSVSFMAIFSIIYFVMKIICFKNLATWPSLMFMCTSIGVVVILELFKRNKLIKELSKEFHL